MKDNLRMGLKPIVIQTLQFRSPGLVIPSGKVNANLCFNSVEYLLPSALADGFYKLLLYLALATFLLSVNLLIQ